MKIFTMYIYKQRFYIQLHTSVLFAIDMPHIQLQCICIKLKILICIVASAKRHNGKSINNVNIV